MARYSKVYTFRKRKFRYDYDSSVVEWLYKEDDGSLMVVDSVGLRKENWDNKEARDEYLYEWCMDIDEEVACYML